MINGSPTRFDVVYTALRRSVDMAAHLCQQDTVIVVDQAVYAKAVEVIWAHPQEFKSALFDLAASTPQWRF